MADILPDVGTSVFQTPRATAALEKYAAVTHLSVRVYGRDERVIAPPIDANPVFATFAPGREPSILRACLERCFTEAATSAVVVDDGDGLAVVGAPFTSDGEVVCVAIAGYALTRHLDQRQIQRLAHNGRLAFDAVWDVVRKGLPIPAARLPLYGELLRIIGDTLLSEHAQSRQLQVALTRLEAADRSKDEFLATLSHELRSPLTSILGYARMLRGGRLDAAKSARALETIERNAHAQTRLIDDLLEVSRIVAGKVYLDTQRVDLAPTVEAVVDAIRAAADGKAIDLQSQLDSSVGPVSGDPDRLRQIFTNLLSNAVKFTPSGGRIGVRLHQVASEARIVITDTGQGMSPELLPHVFERFRQADSTSSRRHGGLGLGLAIARHLAEAHGGGVTADSEGVGRGTTFTVSLPLLSVPLERAEAPVAPRDASVTALHGARVLVTDDNDDTRALLKIFLEQGGAQVAAAASADEALTMLEAFSPDVLVCDIGMPGTDGYSFMRTIRAAGGSVPAVAVTGYAGWEDRQRALAAGYQAHLAKPVEPEDLVREVARLSGYHRGGAHGEPSVRTKVQ